MPGNSSVHFLSKWQSLLDLLAFGGSAIIVTGMTNHKYLLPFRSKRQPRGQSCLLTLQNIINCLFAECASECAYTVVLYEVANSTV